MNARNMLKVFALAMAVASVGCTQRTIIEEPVGTDEQSSPAVSATANGENAIANHPLYVRSGDPAPGETQSGPFPEPWQQRLGPFPEPWHREGSDNDDGRSPPPPDNNPDPDPNPKP